MKLSQLFFKTLKEIPQDADTPSHVLMLRAGLMLRLASGIYNYLPLGWRVLKKIQDIVRDEMNLAGGQELLMPALNPAELWQETGRWETMGNNMFRLKDRHSRDFCLGMTHEETITDIVRRLVRSYKELPIMLYQIQTKFRDEPRPRAGVIRAREFIMKDLYSFHTSWDDLNIAYKKMYKGYSNVFNRSGLDFKVVEADSGPIGGDECHEFMVVCESGEDTIYICNNCGYGANSELAHFHYEPEKISDNNLPLPETISTPNVTTIDALAKFLKIKPNNFIKCLIYRVDDSFAAALVRGDRELNEIKLRKALKAKNVELANEDEIERLTGGPLGFSGPIGIKDITIIADDEVVEIKGAVVGGNKRDVHIKNAVYGRDFETSIVSQIRCAVSGDLCPKCKNPLSAERSIELGHIFKLGTKYSESMKAVYLDAEGIEREMIMGCYGIGVSRIIAAVIEKNHDKDGIIWPISVAPFEVIVIPVISNDEKQMKLAEEIYNELKEIGIEVLIDDRDLRPGVKFKDADLLGIPLRLTIGNKAVEENSVEFKIRGEKEQAFVSREDLVERVKSFIKDANEKLKKRCI